MLPKAMRTQFKDRACSEYYTWYYGNRFLKWCLNKRNKAPKGSKRRAFWTGMIQKLGSEIKGAAARHDLYLQIWYNDALKHCNI